MFRDHPLMTRESGYPNWPPQWTTTNHDKDDRPVGEVGILEDVVMSDLINNKIFLFMLYQGYRYMGVMVFDDPAFCRTLYEILKLRRGFSIKTIGDLDVSQLL